MLNGVSQEKRVGNQDIQHRNRRVTWILVAIMTSLVLITVITVIARN